MEKPIIIFGAGTLGRSVLGILRSHDFDVYGFLDDKADPDAIIDGVPVLGKTDDQGYLKLIGKKAAAVVAYDEVKLRKSTVKYLKEVRKVMPMNAIHSKAVLPEERDLGHGNVIGPGTVIEPGAKLGNHSVFMGNVYVGSESRVGDYNVIGSGSNINPECRVGDNVFIGSGVTIVSGIEIEDNSNIGAGSLVIGKVAKGTTVFGNPAEEVKR